MDRRSPWSRFVVVGAVAAVVVLGGCAGGGAEGGTSGSPAGAGSSAGITDPALASRVFTVTRITEGGADRALAGPEPLTISMAGDGLSARAGCNTLMGTATVVDGVLAVAGPLASTMMACDEELQAQDEWLAAFLTSGPSVSIEGGVVTLASADTVMTLQEDTDAGIYDTPVAGPEDYETATALCNELVTAGVTVDEATARVEDAGLVLRIVSQDGQLLPATTDLNPGRLNLEVEGDVVTGCTAG